MYWLYRSCRTWWYEWRDEEGNSCGHRHPSKVRASRCRRRDLFILYKVEEGRKDVEVCRALFTRGKGVDKLVCQQDVSKSTHNNTGE